MSKIHIASVFVLLLPALNPNIQAQNSVRFSISRNMIANGGTTFSSSSRFQLGSTIGQPLAGTPSSARFSIQGGFWYKPAVEIVAARKVGTNFLFSFETELGKNYLVQYVDSLSNPSWQSLPITVGNGSTKTITNSAIGVAQRYYRLIEK